MDIETRCSRDTPTTVNCLQFPIFQNAKEAQPEAVRSDRELQQWAYYLLALSQSKGLRHQQGYLCMIELPHSYVG